MAAPKKITLPALQLLAIVFLLAVPFEFVSADHLQVQTFRVDTDGYNFKKSSAYGACYMTFYLVMESKQPRQDYQGIMELEGAGFLKNLGTVNGSTSATALGTQEWPYVDRRSVTVNLEGQPSGGSIRFFLQQPHGVRTYRITAVNCIKPEQPLQLSAKTPPPPPPGKPLGFGSAVPKPQHSVMDVGRAGTGDVVRIKPNNTTPQSTDPQLYGFPMGPTTSPQLYRNDNSPQPANSQSMGQLRGTGFRAGQLNPNNTAPPTNNALKAPVGQSRAGYRAPYNMQLNANDKAANTNSAPCPPQDTIAIIQRGDCTFTTKANSASPQSRGPQVVSSNVTRGKVSTNSALGSVKPSAKEVPPGQILPPLDLTPLLGPTAMQADKAKRTHASNITAQKQRIAKIEEPKFICEGGEIKKRDGEEKCECARNAQLRRLAKDKYRCEIRRRR